MFPGCRLREEPGQPNLEGTVWPKVLSQEQGTLEVLSSDVGSREVREHDAVSSAPLGR